MVRLVEERAGFLPGALFISPVGELGAHHRKGVGSDLRIAQPFHWTPGGLLALPLSFDNSFAWLVTPPVSIRTMSAPVPRSRAVSNYIRRSRGD